MVNIETNKPFKNIGPGEFIKEELEVRNWRQEDLAKILGMSLKSINKLIKNKQSITIETAKLLNKTFGQSPQYWINLDTNYRLRLQKDSKKVKDAEIKAEIYKHMPLSEMFTKGWLRKSSSIKDLKSQIIRFWNIQNLDFSFLENKPLPNLRKSEAFYQFNSNYAFSWFQMAKKCASIYKAHPYNNLKLDLLVKNFHQYSNADNGVESLINVLNKAGVKFFVLSHLQKTYIDGASFFDGNNPVIVYTKRYDRADNFWFTVAHEIAHILLHLKNKGDYFIDNLEELNTRSEKEANKFACNILKANEILEYFKYLKRYISQARIEDCAIELDVNPAIVVGVLQHNGLLSRRNLNKFKTSISRYIPNKYLAEEQASKL